jgi:small-conductance mechanosensitive channel
LAKFILCQAVFSKIIIKSIMLKKLLHFLDLEPLENEETLFQNKGYLYIVLFVFGMMLLAGFFIIVMSLR